ncbi:MAG: class I SAM-dependent methyltransferase [Rubrobacteraceae bacterium]
MDRKPHKFDPAKAARLDLPERQQILPSDRLVDLLELRGAESVVDYGAGSGVVTVVLAERLPEGVVYAVDESPEMVEHLTERLAATDLRNVVAHLIEGNEIDLESDTVDRILAVNLLHEIIGEGALPEMRRLLKPEGFLLIADWRSDVSRDTGPPAGVSLSPREGRSLLEEAGFSVDTVDANFPYHFVFVARPEIPA